MKKLLGVIPVFAIISAVFCQDKGNVLSGTMMAGTRVIEKILPGQKKINSTETVYYVRNSGKLEDGLMNKNLLNCPKIKAAFEKVRNTTNHSKCKTFHDLSVVLVRICPINLDKSSQVKGKYTSQVRILKITSSDDNVRQIDFTVTVIYSVEMFDNETKYMQCPIIKSQLNKNNVKQATNTKAVSTSDEPPEKNKIRDLIYQFTLANQQEITVVYLKKPFFLKLVMTREPARNEKQTDCHSLKNEKESEITVKPRKCEANELSNNVLNITKNLDKSVNMMFQDFKDKHKHSMLMYDNRVTKIPSTDNVAQPKEHGRDPRFMQLLVSSKIDIPRKVSVHQLADGKLFAFEFGIDNTTKQHSSSRELVVYVEDSEEQKKENQELKDAAAMNGNSSNARKQAAKEEKASRVVNQVKTTVQTKPGESITNKKEAIEWTLNNEFPTTHPSTKYEAVHPVANPCTSKQITCGILALKIVHEKKLSSPLPDLNNQMMFLKTKKSLNENGEEVGQKDETETKFLNRELPMNKEEKITYETLNQMNPEFEKRIRNAVADIKKSITVQYGAIVWKSAVYTSELLIGRHLSCSSTSCTGSIRAMLEYNMTRKAKPSVKPATILHSQPAASFFKQPLPKSLNRLKAFLMMMTGRLFVYKQQPMKTIKNIATKRTAPTGKIQASADKSKLFFKPFAKEASGHVKKNDVFSKLSGMENTRHFKLESGHLSKDEKIDLLMKILSKRMKEDPTQKSQSATAAATAGAGMCILVALVVNALLIIMG